MSNAVSPRRQNQGIQINSQQPPVRPSNVQPREQPHVQAFFQETGAVVRQQSIQPRAKSDPQAFFQETGAVVSQSSVQESQALENPVQQDLEESLPRDFLSAKLSEDSRQELQRVVQERNKIQKNEEKLVKFNGLKTSLENRIQSGVFMHKNKEITYENKSVVSQSLDAFYNQAHELENPITLFRAVILKKEDIENGQLENLREDLPASYTYDRQFAKEWIEKGDDSPSEKQKVLLSTTFEPGFKVLPMANPLYKEGVSEKGFNQGQGEVCVQPCTYQQQEPLTNFSLKLRDENDQPYETTVFQLNLKAIPVSKEELYAKNSLLKPL